jgi:polysaccharide biosynthesis transport protein
MLLRKIDNPEMGSFELVETRVPASYQPAYTSFASQQISALHYLRILQKRKWLVLATFTIVFAIAAVATFRMTRLYEARSKLAIFPETPTPLNFKDSEGGPYGANDDETDVVLQTQVEILRSDALAMKVIESLHLDRNPDFAGVRPATTDVGVSVSKLEPDPTRVASLLGGFHGGLTVQVVPRTRLISVGYVHPNPRLATEIVNELVRTFIEENFRTKYETVMQTSDWLSKELSDVQLKMETSEEKLVRYQKEHGILGVDEKQNIVTTKLDSLNATLTAAQTDRMQKEADYRLAASGEPNALIQVSNNAGMQTLLDKLQEKEADLNEQYAQVTTAFGSAYPKTVELKNQLDQVRASMAIEQGRIRDKIKNQYLAAVQREKLLQDAFEHQKQDANELNQSAIEFTSLKRDAESNRELYLSMLQRLKEAGVTAGLRSSNIRVVDVARVPTSPFKPDVNRNLMMGLLAGLAAAIGLALVMERIDSTVRNLEEITAVSALPALGTIPLSADGGRRRGFLLHGSNASRQLSSCLVTCADPRSQAAESYRALRTSILLSSSSAPPKVLLVTSALQEEGKTTISANAAIVLAQKGSRVLLIDADLRRPGLGQMLELHPSSGLSTLLSGVDKHAHFLTPISDVPTLSVLPAGPIPPNPAELLSSDTMKAWLARWRNEFDYIVIDSPPCLSVTDAVALSVDADKVIFVARAGQTTKAALRRASELLSNVNANVMGVVLNCLDSSSDDYYTYYNPKYGGYRAYGKEPEKLRDTTSQHFPG